MKKYPFIKQEGIKDCGPACLLMIIKYYKGYIPLEQLRDICKTTKFGTDAYHLVETAKEVGFFARGIKTDLNNKIILPVIAHIVINGNLGHYVVIYKINFKHNYLIIGDPSKGIRKMKMTEFLSVWNNILIELFPIRTIPIAHETSDIYFFIHFMKVYKRGLLILFISSLLITLFSCISSFYFRIIVDNIYTSSGYLTGILIVFIMICFFKMIMEYLRNKVFLYFKQNVDMDMSCEIFNQIIDLPYRYYRNRTTGEIISRFDDLEHVRQMLYRIIFSLFSDLPFILGTLILLFCIDLKLALLVLLVFVFYTFSVLVFNPIFRKYISRIQEQGAITNSFMTESINGFETVQNCSLKNKVKEQFADNYYKLLNISERFSNFMNIRYSISEMIYQIGVIVIVYLGAILVLENKLSVGNLVMFYSVFISFIQPLKNIIELDLSISESKSALKRMLSIFVKKEETGIITKIEKKNIEFRHLNFYYNDIDLILKNIKLTINSGEKLLVIGKSGSGKSTLLKLLMKYYDISGDCLYINNVDINYYTKDAIESSIGYISQQEILFNNSIQNNLDSHNLEEMIEICKICEIDSIMQKRELNFHSMIEENGFNLSGGERQRIILGRLLLKKFDILLIDEGLNQMDVSLERRILKRVFKKYPDKTMIIVSHRMDNMDLYNHVVELSNGKIIKDVVKNV